MGKSQRDGILRHEGILEGKTRGPGPGAKSGLPLRPLVILSEAKGLMLEILRSLCSLRMTQGAKGSE